MDGINHKLISDSEWDEFLKYIGLIVIQWGLAEQCLDFIIALFFKKYGTNLNEKQLQKMLDPKLKFAKKCFSRIPELRGYKTEGYRLISEFDRLGQKRHEIIHGALSHLPTNDIAIFSKLNIKNNLHHARSIQFHQNQGQILTQEFLHLAIDTANLVQQLVDNIP
jgi:hypothetical protein